MSTLDIIRASKDEEYRLSLDETLLPAHPAELVELTDADLEQIAGGGDWDWDWDHHHHHHDVVVVVVDLDHHHHHHDWD